MAGSSAAYDMGEQAHERGTAGRSGAGGQESHAATSSLFPTLPCLPSQPPDEEEAPGSLPWCVDRGDCLQAMSTPALWNALELGDIPPSSRVWREGMECWTPASDVRELAWTLSERPPACEGAPPSPAPSVSVALTPAELAVVAPLWAGGAPPGASQRPPGSTRANRASMPTLPSNTAAAREPSPISLDLPASFPLAPPGSPAPPAALEAPAFGLPPALASQPLDLRAALASQPLDLRAALASQPFDPRAALDTEASLAPQIAPIRPSPAAPPASGLRRLAGTLAARRTDALCVAAGCAVAALALGASALLPSPRVVAAQPGLAAPLAIAAALPPLAAGERPGASPSPGAAAPASITPRTPGGPARLARPAPPSPREPGQARRRGRSEPAARRARP